MSICYIMSLCSVNGIMATIPERKSLPCTWDEQCINTMVKLSRQ